MVSSSVFCAGSVFFLPRFALGGEPVASFLRFLFAGDDFGTGGDEL
jgi:hypothetical protein